jgi:hypothetical protein
MQRQVRDSNRKWTGLNFVLAIVALAVWGWIGLVLYTPQLHTSTPPRASAPSSAKSNDPSATSDSLQLLINGDKALRDCLEKVNPSDPLGVVSSETPEQATQRKACMEERGTH